MANSLPTQESYGWTGKLKESSSAIPVLESFSLSMRSVEAAIRELARSNAPILLLGEPGAGKHATARRIHEMSGRSESLLRSFRASIVTPEDLDTAYGGSVGSDAGSIFLDELADLSDACQAFVIEALLPRNPEKRSPRWICGSSRDLEAEVSGGRLREELYYQIRGVCLRLPPLRQRKEDILRMAEHFLRHYAQEFRCSVPKLGLETQRLFQEYSWPGNFHELENAARILAAFGDERLAMGGLRSVLHKPAPSFSGSGVSLKAVAKAASHEAERELILEALTRTRWNRRRAAKELQISYKALLYKLKQIAREELPAAAAPSERV